MKEEEKEQEPKADMTILVEDYPGHKFGLIRLRKVLEPYDQGTKEPILIEIQDPIFGRIFDALNSEKGSYGTRLDQITQFDDRVGRKVPSRNTQKQPTWFIRVRCLGNRIRRDKWS